MPLALRKKWAVKLGGTSPPIGLSTEGGCFPSKGNCGSEGLARSLESTVSGGDYAGDTLRL